MRYKKFVTSTGREIHIYDDLVTLQMRNRIFRFIERSSFRIGWADCTSEKLLKNRFLHSVYSEDDNHRAGLYEYLTHTPVKEHIKDLRLTRGVVNLSTSNEVHHPHNHDNELVVLYYANLNWATEWYGETIFYSENLKEIELAVTYVPGRVVVFDATIPHTIRNQSVAADNYRYTYMLGFDKQYSIAPSDNNFFAAE